MNETVAGRRFFPHFLPLLVGSCITCHGSPTESLSAYFLTALARVVICLLSFLIVNLFFFWNFKRCRVAGLELNITLLEMGQAGGFNWSYLVVFIVYIDCIKFL